MEFGTDNANELEVKGLEERTSREKRWETLMKYFLHGILFSGLFLVLGIVWAVIFVFLVVAGLFIGFIIGVIVLFLIIGGLNTLLADFIWGILVNDDWKSLLLHGFVLFITLLIASIPSFIINQTAPSLVTSIILFLIYCFIDGFIAKNVAAFLGSATHY